MTAQELTAALVGVYARLRRGDLDASAARREASGYFVSLRELAAVDRREKAGEKAAAKAQETRVEMCYIPGDYAETELVRLTPDLRPWTETEAEAGKDAITPEDVELLEVNAVARARRGEIPESTARAEAYVLKAIRYGLALAPVAGPVTWGEFNRATVEGDIRRGDRITLIHHIPDEAHEPITGPLITFVHGFPVAGQPETEDTPPWPIHYLGKVTGYFVPKGWTKPQGEEFSTLLERFRAAGDRME